ncbi:TRAP transporter large permease subunit, partial [Acinetobacter guillouiae]
GILIPPSIMLVIMADQMALSVGDLFMAAVFPGVIIGALYLTYIFVIALVKRDVAPVPEGAKRPDWNAVKDVMIAVLPTLALILS